MMKKRTIVIFSLSVLAALLVLSTCFLIIRSDYRFILTEKFSSLTRSADVEKINCPYTTYTMEELKTLEHIVINDSLLLVNDRYVLSNSYHPTIVLYKDVEMSDVVTDSYASLVQAVRERFDTALYIRSSYRTAEEQAEIFESSASDVAASVGSSEHQTGLALDVYVSGYSGSAFIRCDAGRFVNQNGWQYGFIIRYPHGKTNITGITYEPWHLRYVGAPHAELIYQNSLTLEEYITEFLIPDVFYAYENYVILRQAEGETIKIPDGAESVTVSPDNTGHLIITAYFPKTQQ